MSSSAPTTRPTVKEDKKTNLFASAITPLVDTARSIPKFGLTCFSRFTLYNAEANYLDPATKDFTKTKTPATYVKQVMATVPVDAALEQGIKCQKITSGGKFHNRILTISNDRFALFITHHKVKGSANGGVLSSMASKFSVPLVSRKGIRGFGGGDVRERYVRYVDVADISFIHEGFPCTRKMEMSRTRNRLKGKKSVVDVNKHHIVSIIHRGNDSLDVLIDNSVERQALVQTLKAMIQKYHEAKFYVVDEARLLRYIWYDVDINQDGMVSETEFIAICDRINVSLRNPRQVYQGHKTEHQIKGNLTYRQCMALIQGVEEGKYDKKYSMQSVKLWVQLFGKVDYVSDQDFLVKFLHACQREADATIDDVRSLFRAVNSMEVNRNESALPVRDNFISRTRFKNYLHHFFNAAFDPDQQPLNRALMHRPLTEYWINTSHNTYLTGDQLQSISSVECYAKALRRGCKCLELDCYDGEMDSLTGEPIPVVYHGSTLTSKILFEDIVEAVKAYLESNPGSYPIILSLENHCSKPFQHVMADILREFLGTLLYAPFEDKKKSKKKTFIKDMEVLPSPEALRGKVIVKGKRPPDEDENKEATQTEEADEEDPYDEALGESIPELSTGSQRKSTKKHLKETIHANMTLPGQMNDTDQPKPNKIVGELAALTLFHGIKFKSFKKSMEEPTSHMHSIGETKISKIIAKDPKNADLWRRYNSRHMTRTYPAGTRVDSSNYNPILAWSVGCQMVALNFQTNDTPLLLNDGRFRQNGYCGYVLKPPSVLGQEPVQRLEPVTVKIRVLSGCCLPKPDGTKKGEHIDPYVKITVHDVQRKGGKDSLKTDWYSTETITDNGFCPNWDELEYHQFQVYSPDVAMIHFSLMEADIGIDQKISDCVIPLICIRQGYRSLAMHDKQGTRAGAFGFATLLVDIQFDLS